MIDVAVTGATGRMGRAVLETAADRTDVSVAVATSRSESGQTVAGTTVEPSSSFPSLLAEHEPDAVVDFTAPAATAGYATQCAETGTALVTGTTGLDDEQRETLERAAERIPLLHAPNFSRGIQALLRAIEATVGAVPGYDVEVLETHHSGKRDAPSGTAGRIVETLEETGTFSGRTHGRQGEAPRTDGEIGVHAVRAGDVTGEHTVLLAGNHEELRLTHRAEDRGVFAAGALDAAVWLAGRDPGQYDFASVVGR